MCCIVLTLHLMHTNLIKLFIVSILFFSSCKPTSEEDEVVPETVLSEEQLVNVLTDAYLAEGASGINVKNVTGEKFDSAYVFNPLKDNNIDKVLFDSSMAYYTRHPKKLKIIYDKILVKLSVIQANGKVE
jgi:hypothetical protein